LALSPKGARFRIRVQARLCSGEPASPALRQIRGQPTRSQLFAQGSLARRVMAVEWVSR
jgi:hypothetical protein